MQTRSHISTPEPQGCVLLSIVTKMVKVGFLETSQGRSQEVELPRILIFCFFLCLKHVLEFQQAPERQPKAQTFMPGDAKTPGAPHFPPCLPNNYA